MMKTYDAVIEYLYARLPMFTRDGSSAFKKDLDNTIELCKALDNPHQKFKSIHVAGTNGKGSTSHMLASIFAAAGYKTGLYTSPHLLDFRERIRVNGEMIGKERVISFVNAHYALIEAIQPSFFEVTVALAFDYFARENVDIAIVEVGLGGRLDSTNIIMPELSVITNIGMDHMNMLGNTLAEIASEKAGIIKRHVPVIVSEYDNTVAFVFEERAEAMHTSVRFASNELTIVGVQRNGEYLRLRVKDNQVHDVNTWEVGLSGLYQQKNVLGVLTAVDAMRKKGWSITEVQLQEGLRTVHERTGLQGRWQTLGRDPWIICDTGHNEDGIREVVENLQQMSYKRLHFVVGAMRDKDLSHMLPRLPQHAMYYFSHPDMPRAMPAGELQAVAATHGLIGKAYSSVSEALAHAKSAFEPGDLIFVGGSNFVVAEVLRDLAGNT
ncbi:bifunctional folylpolyglutamate synthase/dihydrofolate synthase [Sphingobacterium suaedae]|uniref:Dihydrofolate synthase/folylpolyglutamate synthase n=1 Tax=Sphingobacterium suaedae TaxID=1686402 RepID=A0ABW5KII5_9SPHI